MKLVEVQMQYPKQVKTLARQSIASVLQGFGTSLGLQRRTIDRIGHELEDLDFTVRWST